MYVFFILGGFIAITSGVVVPPHRRGFVGGFSAVVPVEVAPPGGTVVPVTGRTGTFPHIPAAIFSWSAAVNPGAELSRLPSSPPPHPR